MLRKIFTGGVAIAVAMAAVLLVTVAGGHAKPAEAVVASMGADSNNVTPNGQTIIRIQADPSGFGNISKNSDYTISVTASAGTIVPRNAGAPAANPSGDGCSATLAKTPCAYNHGGNSTAAPTTLVRLMGWLVTDGLLDIDGGGVGGTADDDCNSCAQGMRVQDGAIDVNRNGVIDAADIGVINGFNIIGGAVDMNFNGVIDAGDDSDNTDELLLTFTAPGTPGTVTFTACQPTAQGLGATHGPPGAGNFPPEAPVCQTLTINVGGGPSRVEFEVIEWNNPVAPAGTPPPITTGACLPVQEDVLDATTANGNNDGQPGTRVGQLCARVFDASNTALNNALVNFTVGAGQTATIACNPGPTPIPAGQDTTGPTGQPTQRCWVTGGLAGTIVRVTAASGSVSAFDDVRFGGSPAACEIIAPASVAPNVPATIKVNVFDVATIPAAATGGTVVPTVNDKSNPAPDGTRVSLQRADQSTGGTGSFVAVGSQPLEGGQATFTLAAATAGPIALVATAPGADASPGASGAISCSMSVNATGAVATATGTGTATGGTGTITGGTKPPATGGFGLFVWGGGTNAQMEAAACGTSATDAYWVTDSSGGFIQYVPQSTVGVVNATWGASVSSGGTAPGFAAGVLPAGLPIIGKCV